jgi:uncharacterized protein (TIRG00374 family)
MSVEDRRARKRAPAREEEPLTPAELEAEEAEEEQEDDAEIGRIQALLQDRRRIATVLVLFVLLLVAIYVLLPKLAGFGDTMDRIGDAKWYWLVVAVGFNAASFAAYAALFRGVLGGTTRGEDAARRRLDLRASYQITMASFAATLLFSAGGAGGILLTYWALRKAGIPRRRAACRMVALLVLLYSVYLSTVIVFGVLLRTHVLPGDAPLAGTVLPAAIAGVLIGIFLLVALIPEDVERRIEGLEGRPRAAKFRARLATGPATMATGVRTAISYVRHPRGGALALVGPVGFWASSIGVLWASFKAFGVEVDFGVVVQGFFLGMAANLLPSFAGGVGSVDAGMIGAFVLFGIPSHDVFAAILVFRTIRFWVPIAPGLIAYFQLRRTVAGWDQERAGERRDSVYTSESKVRAAEAT